MTICSMKTAKRSTVNLLAKWNLTHCNIITGVASRSVTIFSWWEPSQAMGPLYAWETWTQDYESHLGVCLPSIRGCEREENITKKPSLRSKRSGEGKTHPLMAWMAHLSDEKFGREGTGKCGGESTSANCTLPSHCQCCSLLNKLISIIPLCLSLLSVSEGLWMAGGKQANLTVILKMFFFLWYSWVTLLA